MKTWDEGEHLKQDAAELGRYYNAHVAIVLSLVFSLAVVALLSKKHVTNLWVDAAAFAIPIPIALYLRNQIAQLGVFTFITAVIVALGAAVVFGL